MGPRQAVGVRRQDPTSGRRRAKPSALSQTRSGPAAGEGMVTGEASVDIQAPDAAAAFIKQKRLKMLRGSQKLKEISIPVLSMSKQTIFK